MPIALVVCNCAASMLGKRNINLYFMTPMQHWTKLQVSGDKPPARYLHATCSIAGPSTGQQHPLLMVVGGFASGAGVLRDVWLLDVDKGVWSEVGKVYAIVHCT